MIFPTAHIHSWHSSVVPRSAEIAQHCKCPTPGLGSAWVSVSHSRCWDGLENLGFLHCRVCTPSGAQDGLQMSRPTPNSVRICCASSTDGPESAAHWTKPPCRTEESSPLGTEHLDHLSTTQVFPEGQAGRDVAHSFCLLPAHRKAITSTLPLPESQPGECSVVRERLKDAPP